jgi:phosphonoacetate hydrolase
MPSLMRCGTILAALADAGVATAAVTAKDKLRLMLARGLKGLNFSSEHADRATEAANGIGNVEAMVGRAKPDQYSGDLSLYVLDAGLRLLERKAATLLYLSLSDFIQHAHAPGTPEANAFNGDVDARIAAMVAAGAVVGVVADHGMNDKSRPAASPTSCFCRRSSTAASATARCGSSARSPTRSCAITGRSARSCASTRARRPTSRR